MLIPLREEELEQYVDWSYEIALDETRYGYPI